MTFLDKTLIILILLGIFIYCLGTFSNYLVITTNNGKFPAVIYENELLEKTIIHQIKNDNHNLIFLSDIFRIHFPIINEPDDFYLKSIFLWYKKNLDYPFEGGLNIVSIGDILRWIGSALFLFLLGPLIIRIPFRYIEDRKNE
jgi:hypothetical protein